MRTLPLPLPLHLLAALALLSTTAAAQTSTSSSTSASSTPCSSTSAAACQVIRFGDETIEGAPGPGPAVLVVEPPRKVRSTSLIRLRTDFRAEVLASVSRL